MKENNIEDFNKKYKELENKFLVPIYFIALNFETEVNLALDLVKLSKKNFIYKMEVDNKILYVMSELDKENELLEDLTYVEYLWTTGYVRKKLNNLNKPTEYKNYFGNSTEKGESLDTLNIYYKKKNLLTKCISDHNKFIHNINCIKINTDNVFDELKSSLIKANLFIRPSYYKDLNKAIKP